MTTRAEMHGLRVASSEVVAALRDIGEMHVADRLERCAVARSHRATHCRPWTCRSAGCPWCCRALMRRWQATLFDKIGGGADVSTVVVHLDGSHGELRDVVRQFRRAMRDLRDRAGRRRRAWRTISVAGMFLPGARQRIVVLRVRHDGLTRSELAEVFRGRWPGATISVSQAVPHVLTGAMPIADLVSLALVGRGVEPLRIALAPQGERSSRVQAQTDTYIEPMPMLF